MTDEGTWGDLDLRKGSEIKATITERDGKIVMIKHCRIHGEFEDVISIDAVFFKHLE